MNVQSSHEGNHALTNPAFQPYPRNCWYVAAGRAELGRDLLARELLGERIVLYRKENGEPVALQDRCPHRGYPLSKSELIGDQIQCGYHGMAFNPGGQCTHIPSQDNVVKAMRTKAYPLAEKWLWTWIWMGDPELADPSLIPSCGYEDTTEYQSRFIGCVPIKANYQMLIDNLLDPTHASFLHKGGLDNDDKSELGTTAARVEQDGPMVRQVMEVKNFDPQGIVAQAFQLEEGFLLNRTLINMLQAPCFVNVITTFTDAAHPDRIVSEIIASIPIVPAGIGRCYHFVATSTSQRGFEGLGPHLLHLIDQDVVALEAIQAASEVGADAFEMSVRSDETGVRARRILIGMVEEEQRALQPAE